VTGSTKPNKPFILGVAGGSGSGKTHFARALRDHLSAESCEIVYQDNFYIDQSKKFDHDGGAVNFDHPDAIDFALLTEKIGELKRGSNATVPIYDFVTHSRKKETLPVRAAPVILVDGILIFHWRPLRELFDELVFFDAPEELRFQRRLERDVQERGRNPEGVRNQFFKQVKPMHDRFVEPCRAFAHTVVKDLGDYGDTLAKYCDRLGKRVGK
jgi:uridine kinase